MMNMKNADLATSVVLVVLGIAMVWGGFVMDRLEIRGIHPASIPGLVPMGIGGAIVICGAALFATSLRGDGNLQIDFGDIRMLVWTAGLCATFALILVGHLPFFVATFLFISTASLRFSWRGGGGIVGNRRQIVFALASGLIFSALIAVLFRYAFLVRLP
jgi:hypothetical protein